jgi:hypothetical protein
MLVTYDIMQKVPSQAIQKENQTHQHSACDWFQFCREVILDFIESKSEMIGRGCSHMGRNFALILYFFIIFDACKGYVTCHTVQ